MISACVSCSYLLVRDAEGAFADALTRSSPAPRALGREPGAAPRSEQNRTAAPTTPPTARPAIHSHGEVPVSAGSVTFP